MNDLPTTHADVRAALAMEHSAIGMALVGPDGSFLAVNPALCTMLDRDEAALVATSWQEVTYPEDLDVNQSRVSDVLAGVRHSYRLRKRYVRPDGRLVWGDLSVSCVRDEAGSVEYFIAQVVDVTEEVAARDLLAASEARFRLLAEHASDVVVLINVDGSLEWASPSLTRTLGWSPDVVVGSPVWDLIHPDDWSAVADVLASDNEAIHGMPDVELRLKRTDGTFAWMLAAGRHATDRQMVVSLRQIDEAVRARAEVTEAKEHYRLLAENASDVVFLSGGDGPLAWVSPSVEEVLGWRPAELLGRRYSELVHPDDVEKGRAAQAVSLKFGTRPDAIEARIATRDGGWRWMADRGRALRDSGGNLIGGIDALRDIHAEVMAREAQAQSETRYRLLADNATDVVYLVGPDRLVTWISPAVTDSLGWTPEELTGSRMYDLVHPDDGAEFDALRSALYAGQDVPHPPGGWPARFRCKDGSYLWMALRTTTIHDENGSLVSAVTGMKDVDALIKARDRAQAEEARLAATLDSLLDPHVSLEAVRGEDHRIIDFVFADANEAACHYVRIERSALKGARLLDVFPGEAGEGMLAICVDAVESGRPIAADDYVFAYQINGQQRRYDIRGVRVGDSLSFTWRDVTDRHVAVEAIARSEEQYRLLAANSSDVVMRTDDGLVSWISPSLETTLGWEPARWIGRDFFSFIHPDEVSRVRREADDVLAGRRIVMRFRVLAADGDYHWIDSHAQPFITSAGEPEGVVSSFRVVDRNVSTEQELERRASYDDLTGLLRRETLFMRLAHISQRRRQAGDVCALAFCDIDGFKAINDTFGHAAGDTVLRALAERIRSIVRMGDAVARVGGDEFLVVLDGVRDLDDAARVAEKLRAAAELPIDASGTTVTASLSIGITLIDRDETIDAMVRRADDAMYRAKAAGRNRVVTIPAEPELPFG